MLYPGMLPAACSSVRAPSPPTDRFAENARVSSGSRFLKLAMKPRPCLSLVSLDRSVRNADNSLNVLLAQPTEIAQLDNLALPRVKRCQPVQRFIEGDDFGAPLL